MSELLLDPRAWLLPRPAVTGRRPVLTVVGGDGIGPEVVDATLGCLETLGAEVELRRADEGAAAEDRDDATLSEALQRQLRDADAILFGAADTSFGTGAKILRFIRFQLETYANVRPAVSLPLDGGAPDAPTNLVIVRELTEGMYPGREGDLADLRRAMPDYRDRLGRPLPESGAFALRVITEAACARIGRYAAELAAQRAAHGLGRGHVTVVTKRNVLRDSDGLFLDTCVAAIEAVGGLSWDEVYVDEAARRLVACPDRFDVVVTSNLFGDILSDIACEQMGGIALSPSAGIGDGVSYFEAVHGSAPDIAGQDVANPAGTLLSAGMLLAYLGQDEPAARLMGATLASLRAGCRTRDLGGDASCTGFAADVARRLQG